MSLRPSDCLHPQLCVERVEFSIAGLEADLPLLILEQLLKYIIEISLRIDRQSIPGYNPLAASIAFMRG